MSFPSAALGRLLASYYNSSPVADGNPGGLAANGHVGNFPAALKDIGDALSWLNEVAGVLAAPGSAPVSPSAFRNELSNGDFTVWQRGAVFANVAHTAFSANRWKMLKGAATTPVSRSADVPPTGAIYSLLFNSDAPLAYLQQTIDGGGAWLAGKRLALTGWCKGPAGAAAKMVIWSYASVTVIGTGGWQPFSVIADIPATWPASGGSTDATVQLFSTATGAWNVADVQLAICGGSVAPPFERRPASIEQLLCRRYYQSLVVPTQNGSRMVQWSSPMRAAPSVSASLGTVSYITSDACELTHTGTALSTLTADAEI